jgi:hypothetical protein
MTDVRVDGFAREVAADGTAPVEVAGARREVALAGAPSVRAAGLQREVARGGANSAVRVAGLRREISQGGPAHVRVAGFYREIIRSRRDSPYPHFPVRLFCPPTLYAALEGGAIVGGVSPGQDASIEAMDSGGRWVMEFGEAPLWDVEKVHAWRMFSTAADLGVMGVIVPLWDRLHQAFAEPRFTGSTTFGQIVWRDTPLWEADEIQAVAAETALAHATVVRMTFAGGELAGGEHFSIYGPRYGWRLYRIVRVVGVEAGVTELEIRPPLREWLEEGRAINFDSPRCTMRCDGDLSEVVEMLRFGKGVARFVETFNRYP